VVDGAPACRWLVRRCLSVYVYIPPVAFCPCALPAIARPPYFLWSLSVSPFFPVHMSFVSAPISRGVAADACVLPNASVRGFIRRRPQYVTHAQGCVLLAQPAFLGSAWGGCGLGMDPAPGLPRSFLPRSA